MQNSSHHEEAEQAIIDFLKKGPRSFSDVRWSLQKKSFFNQLASAAGEKLLIQTVESLALQGRVTVKGQIPCNQVLIEFIK